MDDECAVSFRVAALSEKAAQPILIRTPGIIEVSGVTHAEKLNLARFSFPESNLNASNKLKTQINSVLINSTLNRERYLNASVEAIGVSGVTH